MDEPLSNLDAKLRSQMRTELQRLHEELGVTTIYVTHDQTEAMTMGDRIAILNAGELQQIAEPEICYSKPNNRFVAGFIGSPSMNFFEVSVESTPDGVSVEGDSFETDLNISLSSGRYTLGVRPEDLYLADGPGRIPADVDVVEPMGADNYLYLIPSVDGDDEGDHRPCRQRVSAQSRRAGHVRLRCRRHSFFDETGDRVTTAMNAEQQTT